jgi:hypothetical protein
VAAIGRATPAADISNQSHLTRDRNVSLVGVSSSGAQVVPKQAAWPGTFSAFINSFPINFYRVTNFRHIPAHPDRGRCRALHDCTMSGGRSATQALPHRHHLDCLTGAAHDWPRPRLQGETVINGENAWLTVVAL